MWRFPRLLRGEHDRRAMGIVGADEMHFVTLHPLEAHPDVGLDVLHDVADVERTVGVGQRRRDKQRAARHAARNLGCDRGMMDFSKAVSA